MVLEAFGAIALAGNILQFIEFTSKVVSKSVDVYHSASGASQENIVLQTITEELRRLSDSIAVEHVGASEDDQALVTLAGLCRAQAVKLMTVLQGLNVRADGKQSRKWESVYQALKSEWKKDEIEEFQKTLARFQTQIIFQLVKSTRYEAPNEPSYRTRWNCGTG